MVSEIDWWSIDGETERRSALEPVSTRSRGRGTWGIKVAGIYDQFFSVRVGGKTPRLGSLIPALSCLGAYVCFQLFTFDRR